MNKKMYLTIGVAAIAIVALVAIYLQFFKPINVKINSEAEVVSRFDNKDDFLLVIGDSLCSACKEYKEGTISEYVKKYGTKNLIYLYSDKISFGNSTDFAEFKTNYDIIYNTSPTTYYIKDGQVVASNDNLLTLAELEAFIEANK